MNINDLTHKIIGCAMKVHNELGCGFQERIYQRALAIEMEYAGLTFSQEQEMDIHYRDTSIGTRRVDFFVENRVMVEIKAVVEALPAHTAQGINYLEIYGIATGLLLNFGGRSLEFKRLYNKRMGKD